MKCHGAIILAADTLEEGSGQQVPSALRFGVSAQNMQLMKASFFDDDNNADGDSGKLHTAFKYYFQ